MTYGNPSIGHALDELRAAGATRIVVLPLYPQYSATTTAAALDRVDAALARWPAPPARLVIDDYHAEPGYIDALAASIRAARAPFDHLLFSFHGIPQRYADRGDPYGAQCLATARLVAGQLALPDGALVGRVPVPRRRRALARALHGGPAAARSRSRVSRASPSPAPGLRWTASRPSRRSRSAARRPLSPPAGSTSSTSRRSTTTRRRWTASPASSSRGSARARSAAR